MENLDFIRTQGVEFAPTDYLHRRIDAATCAKILGVSAARWRQIAGSRTEPNPALPSQIITGERGARWSLRDVLTYALDGNRELRATLPATLPLPQAMGVRYTTPTSPAGDRLSGYELTAGDGNSQVRVWAQMFLPTSPERCGQPEGTLLLFTPLWPASEHDILDWLDHLVTQAYSRAGWEQALPYQQGGLSVVILPVTEASDPETTSDALVVSLPYEELRPLARPAQGSIGMGRSPLRLSDRIPAADIADCLDWPALPWWPEGTTTRSLCAQWRPGHPVSTDVPASLQARARATRWIMQLEPQRSCTREDLVAVAQRFDPARQEGIDAQARSQRLGRGYELAAALRWEPLTPAPDGTGSPERAQDRIMSAYDAPDDVATTLCSVPIDPSFAAPVHIPRGLLPQTWFNALQQGRHSLPDRIDLKTPRWKHLLATHDRESQQGPGYSAEEMGRCELGTIGHLEAPIAVDDSGLTIAAPTGYIPSRFTGYDTPSRCLPDREDAGEMTRFLIVTTPSGDVRGFYLTDWERVGPLPANALWKTGLEGQALALTAAFTGLTLQDAIAQRPAVTTTTMEQLLASSTTPLEISLNVIEEAAWESVITKRRR